MHVKLESYCSPFWGILPPKWGAVWRRPQKAHPWAETRRMTYRSSKSVPVCGLVMRRRIKQKFKKGTPKKPQHVFFHVFAQPQTSHVVEAPHGIACVGIPATRLYIPSFIKIRSGVSEPHAWGQNLAFHITLASRFYNSLYYRTSRDWNVVVSSLSVS